MTQAEYEEKLYKIAQSNLTDYQKIQLAKTYKERVR